MLVRNEGFENCFEATTVIHINPKYWDMSSEALRSEIKRWKSISEDVVSLGLHAQDQIRQMEHVLFSRDLP